MKLLPSAMLLVYVATSGMAEITTSEQSINPAVKEEVRRAVELIKTEEFEEYDMVGAWKEAGASYLKILTAPAKKADQYVNAQVQRTMIGIYLMDMNYAQVFGRYNDAKKLAEALDILFGKLGFRSRELQRCCQNIMDHATDSNRNQLYKELDDAIDQIWIKYIDTDKGLDLVIDGVYGWILEGLYISSEIAAQQDYKPAFMHFMNQQMNYFNNMKETLSIFEKDSALASMVEQSERLQIIQEVLNQLGANRKITPRDVIANRRLISQARNEIMY